MKKLYQKILKYFVSRAIVLNRLKEWGIVFEYNLPPELIITDHADQRMKERFKCNPIKIKKIVMKAWNSPDMIPPNYIQKFISKQKSGKYSYKSFCGNYFIFKLIYKTRLVGYQKLLVTVINPRIYEHF